MEIYLYYLISVLLFTALFICIIYPKMKDEYTKGLAPQQNNPTYFTYWDGHRRSIRDLVQTLQKTKL